jgi:protein TonB
MNRRLLIVTAVIGLHMLGLWALHTGLLRRAVELVIPVQVLAELIEPPQPVIAPAPPAPPTPTPPKPVPRQPPPKPVARPAPPPLASVAAEPTPQAPVAVTTPQPITSTASPVAEVVAPAAPAPAPPAPARVDLPSSGADYLNNPPPPYPPLSKRLNEQGRVVIRARIEVDGSASQAEVRTSSGYERLDQAALQTVKRWRYVPGKRAGVPEAMWFNIPIQFVLD